MILSEASIQQVRDVSITDVVANYVKLSKRGANQLGLCPFHNEKTPSFNVSEAKGIFKCFGCGASGDAIEFVMRHDKLDFIAAVEAIGALQGIAMQYEEVPDKEKYEKEKALKDQLKDVLRFTNEAYKKNLFDLPADDQVMQYLIARGITKDVIINWQLGWATIDWRHISPQIINRDLFTPAEKLGIVKRSKDGEKNYDGYRSRITIPLTNRLGECIGLAGRHLQLDPADQGREYAKYINPPENELYSKSQILFGLSRAQKAIDENGFVHLVEGYFDVISMHENGDVNTVGKCGTAFTDQQAALLKKYTNHVVIVGDGDSAGRAATIKDVKIAVKAGFKTEVALLPDNVDPDSWIQNLKQQHDPLFEILDGVLWYIDSLVCKIAKNDHFKLGKAKEEIVQFISTIPNDLIRNNYFDNVIRHYKWLKTDLQKQLTTIIEDQERQETVDDGMTSLDRVPAWMNKEEYLTNGFSLVNNRNRTGYYTMEEDRWKEVSNFIISPLFNIRDGQDSRHLILVDNGRKKEVVDIETKILINKDLMNNTLCVYGAFQCFGTQNQVLRIGSTLLSKFPTCYPIKFLGWQKSGFFSFVDKVFIPGNGLVDLNEWGIVNFKENNFIVRAASAAYKEAKELGNDEFENDRVLTYKESSLSFAAWGEKMVTVYKEKGPVAIAFTVLTLFRDIVFNIENNCPHLYAFGERSSGKSKWAESIYALFYQKRSAFPLSVGTDNAFFQYMRKFVNCPSWLNEFDEKSIKLEWFGSIKGVFDGESRQRGVLGNKNRIETMKVDGTLILTGQYINTMDDNSIVSRSIIEPFSERENTSDEEQAKFNDLKRHEENGLSQIIVEILNHREFVKENYRQRFTDTLSEWRHAVGGDANNFNSRIMQNWCHLFTCWNLISEKLRMPFSTTVFEDYCKEKGVKWSKFIRSSDTLSEFWHTLSFLSDQGIIVEGWDYKIEVLTSIKVRNNRNEEVEHTFPDLTKVIYIRMNSIHKHYQQAYRTRTGKEGMTMENLHHYFSSRKYYLGNSKSGRFKRFVTKIENVSRQLGITTVNIPERNTVEEKTNTSSFVFLYDMLDLDLERTTGDDQATNGSAKVNGNGNVHSQLYLNSPYEANPEGPLPF